VKIAVRTGHPLKLGQRVEVAIAVPAQNGAAVTSAP
jgi:hypothetical protein